MPLDRIANIFGSIVTVALVTVVVSAPNTSQVIGALGNAFSNSLKAAMGQGSFR